jgi:hypothetical protein
MTSEWEGHSRPTHAIDVNLSRVPEEGVHSPSCPNGLVIIVIIITMYESSRMSLLLNDKGVVRKNTRLM